MKKIVRYPSLLASLMILTCLPVTINAANAAQKNNPTQNKKPVTVRVPSNHENNITPEGELDGSYIHIDENASSQSALTSNSSRSSSSSSRSSQLANTSEAPQPPLVSEGEGRTRLKQVMRKRANSVPDNNGNNPASVLANGAEAIRTLYGPAGSLMVAPKHVPLLEKAIEHVQKNIKRKSNGDYNEVSIDPLLPFCTTSKLNKQQELLVRKLCIVTALGGCIVGGGVTWLVMKMKKV